MTPSRKPESPRKGTGNRKKPLSSASVVGFAATEDAERAMSFYRDKLGLDLDYSDQFALVFTSGGTMIRVQIVPKVVPSGYTTLGWTVADVGEIVARLTAAGVVFSRFPGMAQDAHGVWSSPSGARIAWFTDPDGNTLSLTEL